MKQIQKNTGSFFSTALSMSLVLLLASCGGGGGGSSSSSGGGSSTTTVSGKVTLSNQVVSKPTLMKALLGAPKGKPGSKAYAASLADAASTSSVLKSALMGKALNSASLANGNVYLYNSDHPEWICPVASSATDTDGQYSLKVLSNASCNGNQYTDGDPIPAGNYTILAASGGFNVGAGSIQKPFVAVQTVVNNFEGAVTLPPLFALNSTSLPTVQTMFGVRKNSDGSESWGDSNLTLPANAALQITFSAAMARGSLNPDLSNNVTGISICLGLASTGCATPVPGKWTLSPDWTTATFYPTVSFQVNKTYTVTVPGENDNPSTGVTNVFGNALQNTATGTFTTTANNTVVPTALFVSPSTVEFANPDGIEITTPIRIGSNEQLDVNTLVLNGQIAGVSSLGAKPGVLYIGRETKGVYAGFYIYEFVLGTPLQLGVTYDLTVSGGKGLNGLSMNALTGSFRTVSTTAGVDPSATSDTKTIQADVKDVFGRWIRAFSDRNMTQLKGLMSGDFYFDQRNPGASDVNKDGHLDLGEFTSMLETQDFPLWEACGATITGDIATADANGNPIFINLNLLDPSDPNSLMADFQFKMNSATTNTSQACAGTVPKDNFYLTLKKVNGAWTVVRASMGIDTRSKEISHPNLIKSSSLYMAQDQGLGSKKYYSGALMLLPSAAKITFNWPAVTGVKSYVLLAIDASDPSRGAACVYSSDITSLDISTIDSANNLPCGNPGSTGSTMMNAGAQFLGSSTTLDKLFVSGGQYYWEIVGLGSLKASDAGNPSNTTPQQILNDITAMSLLQDFSIQGLYQGINVAVYAGGTASGPTVASDYGSYNLGAANLATIKIKTGNANVPAGLTGSLQVNGSSSQKTYPLTYSTSTGVATVTVDLSKGWNSISIQDNVNAGSNGYLDLHKQFNITTASGMTPMVAITSVTDDLGNSIIGDTWNFYNEGTGAKKVIISGTVTNPSKLPTMYVNLIDNLMNAYSNTSVTVGTADPVTGLGTFTVTLDTYQGDNWISVGASIYNQATNYYDWYGANLGVYTDTGTVWVPNIAIAGIDMHTSAGTESATRTSVSTSNEQWDASTSSTGLASSDDKVTIHGQFKKHKNGQYNISDDAGSNSGGLSVASSDGSFSLDVTLHHGWTHIYLYDAKYNQYELDILTTRGHPVITPTITKVDGIAPVVTQAGVAGNASSTACMAKIEGVAKAGSLYVYWNGFDGSSYYYESQTIGLNGPSDTAVAFSYTVPLVNIGAGSYNTVNIYDTNWKSAGVQITTSGNCPYVQPVTTISTVTDNNGAMTLSGSFYLGSNLNQTTAVTLTGTTNMAGRSVNTQMYACGASYYYAATTSTTVNGALTYDWTIPGITVYDGYNYLYLTDGYSWKYPYVYTTNGTSAPVPLTATITAPAALTPTQSNCGYTSWDVGSAQTVDISGTTTAPDGIGSYTDASNSTFTFNISGGIFTISGVKVYDGYNYLNIYDTAWNYQYLTVNTTNGIAKPHFVTITSPTLNVGSNSTVLGTKTVTGNIQDPNGSGYAPDTVYAYTYDYVTYKSTSYSSNTSDQTYGYQAITYNPATGAYSFSVNFGSGGDHMYVSVNASDVAYHWVTNYYNSSSDSTFYGKPIMQGNNTNDVAVDVEAMKQRLRIMNQNNNR